MTDKTPNFYVHESAYVDENVQIGKGCRIWHFSHIMTGAVLGNHCNLGQNVCISPGVVIGDNVKIQNNVSVYEGTIVEDDVFLGPSCVLTNVLNPRSQVSRKHLYEKTLIKKGATIGANATIVCGISIGRYAFVAAGAVVTRDIPDYTFVAGVPAGKRGWISRHGIPLTDKDAQGIYTCEESGLRYQEDVNGQLHCLDVEEDAPLPATLARGKVLYSELRKK